jgi:hypothetical protein
MPKVIKKKVVNGLVLWVWETVDQLGRPVYGISGNEMLPPIYWKYSKRQAVRRYLKLRTTEKEFL